MVATYGMDLLTLDPAVYPDNVNPKMLFLNYQFSHPNSSLFLFPINHALAINHNSNRAAGGKPPNAKLQWSTKSKKAAYYRERPLQDLKQYEHYSTLVLDFVATRDIETDEEIFMDYGVEWENAWNQHIENFGSPCRIDGNMLSSKRVYEMNSYKFEAAFHEWSEDHFTVCNLQEKGGWMHIVQNTNDTHVESSYPIVLEPFEGRINRDHVGFRYSKPFSVLQLWHPCVILQSFPETRTFEVVYFHVEWDYVTRREILLLKKAESIPENALQFRNKPFRSDMFWPGAFRHAIEIPDEIFPSHWKDLIE
mmetsp:Transcript_28209/g.65302  ORF Transcript_28209/g.65302 Transcript_28209/m.65302 type:complete len:308 (+) Transcript_28209:537-1460(+)